MLEASVVSTSARVVKPEVPGTASLTRSSDRSKAPSAAGRLRDCGDHEVRSNDAALPHLARKFAGSHSAPL